MQAKIVQETCCNPPFRRSVGSFLHASFPTNDFDDLPHLPTGGPALGAIPTFHGFTIVEEIGRGGMGVVYKARQESTGRCVALKILGSELQRDPATRRRFRREARIAAQLNHPNVVRYLDAGCADTVDFLVMEYVDGMDLDRIVDQQGPLEIDTACALLRQAALGLQHFADMGLVHRDIKPSNLIVTRSDTDGSRHLVITDLGLALSHAAGNSSSSSLLTHIGLTMGTPDFIAPEQVEDSHQVDIRADLYSLGCAFYYAISGRVPFPARSTMEKLERHRWAKPRSLDKLRRDVPAVLSELFTHLLAKRPEDRPQSPAELVAAIDQVTETMARPPVFANPAAETDALAERLQWQVADLIEEGQSDRALLVVEQLLQLRPHDSLALAAHEFLKCEAADGPVGVLETFSGHTDAVHAVCFSHDGERIVSAGADGRILVWDARSFRLQHSLEGHDDAVKSLAVSKDGRLVLSGGKDRRMIVWNLVSGKELRAFRRQSAGVQCVAFAPDGRFLLSGCGDGSLRLWDMDKDRRVRRLDGHRADVHAACFSADGRKIITASWDHTLRSWDVESGLEIHRLDVGLDLINTVVLCPDDVHIVAAGSQGSFYEWNFRDGRLIRAMDGDGVWINCLALSPNGSQIIFGCADGTLRKRRSSEEDVVHVQSAHEGAIQALAVSANGRCCATAGSDHLVRTWRLP